MYFFEGLYAYMFKSITDIEFLFRIRVHSVSNMTDTISHRDRNISNAQFRLIIKYQQRHTLLKALSFQSTELMLLRKPHLS